LARYDGLPEPRKAVVKKPTLLAKETNEGFAAGVNEGIRAVLDSGDFGPPIILHNDTVVVDNWAGEMKACLEEGEEEVAVVVPRTNYANEHQICVEELRQRFQEIKPNNKLRISVEEIRELVVGLYGKGTEPPKILGNETLRMSYCSEVACFCMMARTNLIKMFPKWDEDFFPRGYEDKFWFLPAERQGYVCMISNRSFVHHFGNITSDGPGFCFSEMFQINKERFLRKVRELDSKDKDSRSAV
jgi:GT2 family glycosyltransferase